MKKKMVAIVLIGLAVIAIGYFASVAIRNASIETQIKKEIQNTSYAKVENIGSTSKLEILPHGCSARLKMGR